MRCGHPRAGVKQGVAVTVDTAVPNRVEEGLAHPASAVDFSAGEASQLTQATGQQQAMDHRDLSSLSRGGRGGSADEAPPAKIDKSRNRYPYAIAWTPLPMITWLIPFIGHMGLCDSRGRVHDFAGPYTIGVDDMAFGAPTRYLTLDPKKARSGTFEAGLHVADEEYSHRMHNLCCDNCHSHVAYALNEMGYSGYRNWNMIILCFWILFAGKWVSVGAFLKSWLPFCIIVGIVLFFKYGL